MKQPYRNVMMITALRDFVGEGGAGGDNLI
jgi:hypothetical protein